MNAASATLDGITYVPAPAFTLTTVDRYSTVNVVSFSGDFAERRARLAYADAMANWWNVAARLQCTDPTLHAQMDWRRPGWGRA
jgi:hypothetical protein